MPDRYALMEIPYNFEDLKLGSLVPNITQPNQDAFGPTQRLRPGVDFKWRNQRNFKFFLNLDENSSIKLRLTRLFSASSTSQKEDEAELWSTEGRTYSLTQPKQLFQTLCGNGRAREWIQTTLDDGADIYFVVGLRTFIDATTSDKRSAAKNVDGSLAVPVEELATGSSTGDALDVKLEVSKASKDKETESFEIPGERIFAICYRKLKFQWPFKRDVSAAKLSANNVWVSTSFKRGDSEDDERCIEADIDDEESVLHDSESVTFEVDGSVEELYLFDNSLGI